MSAEKDASGSSFDMAETTPKSTASSATEDMRKLALGVGADPKSDLLVELEKNALAASKLVKSRTCALCPKKMNPSAFDRCTKCEICDDKLVETKCLKDGMMAIARAEDAIDAKGVPDFKLVEAGFSKGRMKTVLNGVGQDAVYAGMVPLPCMRGHGSHAGAQGGG
eukprot:3591493-Rhodomonas_salina.1